ncbi:hypothetical protein ACFX13_030580 [Malus domestica]
MATCHLHSGLGNLTSFKSTNTQASTRRELPRPRLRANSVRCGEATQVTCETHRITVKNGNDSQDICRVLNGMWQTSGGWGRIDRDDAVEAMLRYADAGLSTFDMTSGSWDRIDRDNGVDAMLKYADAGVTTFFLDQLKSYMESLSIVFVKSVHQSTWKRLEGELLPLNHVNIPFAGPPLNTPSLQKYKRMVDAWRGWSLFQALLQTLKGIATKHGVSIANVAVKYVLDQEDRSSIKEVTKKGKNLHVIGDCGDEYRRR